MKITIFFIDKDNVCGNLQFASNEIVIAIDMWKELDSCGKI